MTPGGARNDRGPDPFGIRASVGTEWGYAVSRRHTSGARTWVVTSKTQLGLARHVRSDRARTHARAKPAACGVGDRVADHVRASRVDGVCVGWVVIDDVGRQCKVPLLKASTP